MSLRSLTSEEQSLLESRGCRAADWSLVRVAKDFTPGASFHRVEFAGPVELGVYTGTVSVDGIFGMPVGVTDARLKDVRLGDNCLVRHASLASVDVGAGAIVDRVELVCREGDQAFANGVGCNVLAEDGARSVPLWRHLSSQLAHILCHAQKSPAARALEDMVERDAAALRRERSRIASGCRVVRCGVLKNVRLDEGARVEGAAGLENCHVDSAPEAPAYVGDGVFARDCVLLRGSETRGGARLERCLVGEGARVGEGFNGLDCLFFANSDFGQGEGSGAMAGPFAVSHHKATLVLTCQTSFSTFGSAANSSNHHFKLGPRHGGVLRRGVRCGSGSYLMWPSDIGAFTTVVGQHKANLDTVNFPFSLLIGRDNRSVLIPGNDLFGSGLYRDADKWRARDRRAGVAAPRDLINPAILSPYTLQAMEIGSDLLRRSSAIGMDLLHGGAVIPAQRFAPTLRLYDSALVFHTGERLFHRAVLGNPGSLPRLDDLVAALETALEDGGDDTMGRWRDWGGMLLPGSEADRFLAELEEGVFPDVGAVHRRLREIHEKYDEYEWLWLAQRWLARLGPPTGETVATFVERWRKAVVFRHETFLRDAGKEFSPDAMISHGVEGDAVESFRQVRGVLADHPIVAMAEAERDRLLALTELIPRTN